MACSIGVAGVLADVQAQQHRASPRLLAKACLLHVGQEGVQPLVVEPQPVDQRVAFGNAEHARLGVAGLALGRDGADLHKAETHGGQAVDAAGVLVQARRQAHPVGKTQAGQGDGVVDPLFAPQAVQRRVLEAGDVVQRQFVGGFGVQAKQEGAGQGIGQEGHWIITKFVATPDCLK